MDIATLTKAALNGDAQAQFDLGKRYCDGDGVDKNFDEAVKWFRKAAAQGNADAQNSLGYCYGEGEGVEKNMAEALIWFRKAAEQGVAKAQCNLGNCYYDGDGVDKNLVESVKWYRKAAEQGDAQAQYELGRCYDFGEGVEKDLIEAVKWYKKAAEQGNADAQNSLGYCYGEGEGVEKDLIEAVKWYRKAAEQGVAEAQCNLGNCYLNGDGLDKNLTEAVRWYRKAAEQGDAQAQYELGRCYDFGEGVEKDLAMAVQWYRKAAEQGDAQAQCNLGYCFEHGEGVGKNLVEAVRWYRKAAEQGDSDAQNNLGVCYGSGEGVKKDLAEAVKWLRLSAEQGSALARRNLGYYWLPTQLDIILESYVPTEKESMDVELAKKQHEEFVSKFPIDQLDKLTPETYCIGKGAKDNLCWWIERGTNAFSRYFPGRSEHYGMYWKKEANAYIMAGAVSRYQKDHPEADEAEVLRETIAKPLKRFVESKGENGTFEAINSVGKSFLLKLLILYYPNEFFQVNSTRWIDRFIDAYGLEKSESYLGRNKVLRRFYEEKKSLVKTGELTQQGFIGIVARLLQLIEPRYWHMQLHPTGKSFSKEKVMKIIKDYGVIGMSARWDNDGDQPRHFKEKVHIGDVIGIRENGFVALVRVIGPCRENTNQDDMNWFDIVRPVELLSDDAENYIKRYETETGKGVHDNLFNPATLSPVKTNKNTFLQFWYKSVMGLDDTSDGASSEPESDSTVLNSPDDAPPSTTSSVSTVSDVPDYTPSDFLKEVFMGKQDYEELVELLRKKKNLIFMGAPGVGKTFVAKRLAWAMMGGRFADRVAFVQFHQNYSYEDFICGYKPVEGGSFELVDGVFFTFCKRAAANPEKSYFFIIDEINRGNISKIFGELLMTIEADKRGDDGYAVRLAYRPGEMFVVPKNLYIIGMMNTADRSLAMMDYALRRRFSFYQIDPRFEAAGFKALLNGKTKMQKLVECVKDLNERIAADPSLGPGFVIGHSYFCGDSMPEEIVRFDIVPMLSEYWFDDSQKVMAEKEKLMNAVK